MFTSSYDTSLINPFFDKNLMNQLLLANVEGQLIKGVVPHNPRILALIEDNHHTKQIKSFDHPIKLVEKGEFDKWCIDLRSYKRKLDLFKDPNGGYREVREGSLRLLFLRTELEIIWQEGGAESINYLGNEPMTLFAKWIGHIIQKRYGLSEDNAQRVQILTAWYYYCLSNPHDFIDRTFTAGQEVKYQRKISEALRINIDTVMGTINKDNYEYISDVSEYTSFIAKNVLAHNLANFSKVDLLNITINSWFGGVNPGALIALALEYPPCFISMICMAADEDLYKQTHLTKLIQEFQKKNDIKSYKMRLDNFIKRYS